MLLGASESTDGYGIKKHTKTKKPSLQCGKGQQPYRPGAWKRMEMLRAFPSLPLNTPCKGGQGHTVISRGMTWGMTAGGSFQKSGKAGAR